MQYAKSSAFWAAAAVGNWASRFYRFIREDVEAAQAALEGPVASTTEEAETQVGNQSIGSCAGGWVVRHFAWWEDTTNQCPRLFRVAWSGETNKQALALLATGDMEGCSATLSAQAHSAAKAALDAWNALFEVLIAKYRDGYKVRVRPPPPPLPCRPTPLPLPSFRSHTPPRTRQHESIPDDRPTGARHDGAPVRPGVPLLPPLVAPSLGIL